MDLRLGEFGRQKAVPKRQFLPIKSPASLYTFDLCFLRLLSSLLKELKAISTGAVTEWATSGARLTFRSQSSWEVVSFTCEVSPPDASVSCSSLAQTSASNYRKVYVTYISHGRVLYSVVLRGGRVQVLHLYLLLYLMLQPRVEKKCAMWVRNLPRSSSEILLWGLVFLLFFVLFWFFCPWKRKSIRPVGSMWRLFCVGKTRTGEQFLELLGQ